MDIKKYGLMTGAAVVVAMGLGFGAARLTDVSEPVESERHEEEGGEIRGFIPLTLTAAAQAGVSIVAVERGGGTELKLPGRVAFAPGAEAVVDAPVAGTVMRVHVGPGDRVAVGSALVTLSSPDGAGSRATVDAAQAAADAARAAERRDRALFDQGWVAQARLDITAAEARRAEAELRAARARSGAYGAPSADGTVVVRSPIAGVVIAVRAAPGQALHQEALQVATVADLGRVELVFEAPPSAAGLVRVGDVLSSSLPGEPTMTGVVTAIAPANARGVVLIRARPTGPVPPAGTVVSARVRAAAGAGALTVPMDAVQSVEGAPSVFVAEGGGFRVHPVVTGRTVEGRIEILSGLTGSERIAGTGAFLLKAELANGEAEHGH